MNINMLTSRWREGWVGYDLLVFLLICGFSFWERVDYVMYFCNEKKQKQFKDNSIPSPHPPQKKEKKEREEHPHVFDFTRSLSPLAMITGL